MLMAHSTNQTQDAARAAAQKGNTMPRTTKKGTTPKLTKADQEALAALLAPAGGSRKAPLTTPEEVMAASAKPMSKALATAWLAAYQGMSAGQKAARRKALEGTASDIAKAAATTRAKK